MSILTWDVPKSAFDAALNQARQESDRVRQATSSPAEMPEDGQYFLSNDHMSGYGVTETGELIGVFSLVPGRGKQLIREAVELDGAYLLDCFDGFLPGFYSQFGFVEYKREASWTEGGPDVVYMRREEFSRVQ